MKTLYFPIFVTDNTGQIIFYSILGAVIVSLLILLGYFLLKKNKGQLINGQKIKKTDLMAKWFDALGGKDNVNSIAGVGSRLTFQLKDQTLISRNTLEQLGAKSVVLMTNKVIVIIEKEATKIANFLNQNL